MFLTMAVEIKSEFMLKKAGDSPDVCDFTRKYILGKFIMLWRIF